MTRDQKRAEVAKCKKSVRYFVENYVRIRTPDGKHTSFSQAALEQLELIEKAQNEGAVLKLLNGGKQIYLVIEKVKP